MNKKSVSAIACFIPDPYHALLFRKSYDKYWKDEVDELLVNINTNGGEINDFIASIFKDCKVFNHKKHMNQGQAFDELYPHTKGDILMTLCSDNYIIRKGVVTRFKEQMDKYDVIGSTGLHATPEIANEIVKKFPFVRFNPFMGFFKREILDKIPNLTFEAVDVYKGKKLEGVDFTPDREGRLDIMALMSLQILSLTDKKLVIKPETGDYIHASGMSSAVMSHLGKDGVTVIGRKHSAVDGAIKPGILTWFLAAYLMTVDDCPLKEFNEKYLEAMKRKAKVSGFDFEQLKRNAKTLMEQWK